MHPIKHAQTVPDRPAIIMASSGQTITFGEMDEDANRIARLLRSFGLGRGDAFAVLMENHARSLEIMWGSQRTGTLLVPVSTRLTAPEVAYILKDSDTRLLITTRKFDDVMEAVRQQCPDIRVLVIGGSGDEDFEALLAKQDPSALEDPLPGRTMLYSSGTTGHPKGVKPPPPLDDDIYTPTPMLALATMGAGIPVGEPIVYLSPAPLYHAAPLMWCSVIHRLGGTVVVMEKFEPEQALAAIEKYRVTDSQWVPTHFVRMLKLPEEARTRYDLSSHQRAIHAAAPCPVPIKREMIDWWGPIVIEYYAGSEGIGMTMVGSEAWLERPGTVGRALYGKLHVCGPDGKELAPGEDGVIYFESERLPSYHNDPDKTAAALHREGWMTLGDIGHVDDEGYLFLTDRQSHMIISGGVNIYPQEIENLLVTHPKVMDAAVIGAPDPDFGEKVVAVIQPADMAKVNADRGAALEAELRDFLAPSLSSIKMPRFFEFRENLPREANGKLYKRELKDEFAART